MTALPNELVDICADSFVPDELGVLFRMMIRVWASNCPASAAPAIARCIAHFAAQVFATDPHLNRGCHLRQAGRASGHRPIYADLSNPALARRG
ncbi:hypothetical protein OTB20_38765 [Streptomyces sp. H27-H1]|uniref:hypothetical protein n=1 Tax=Streptomyces sp. H27-H1 TaxID=2996461 RepID=UPI00226D59D3|nr:hypothetical protein [Streptomyces sp. H27-H1]MCY0932020.1 hypothetical protein [Streptomyces sp. H27-H1]